MEIEESGDVVIVRLEDDLDAATALDVRATLMDLVAAGRVRFVIDLDRVDFVDSAGVATLVALYKRVRLSGGDVKLAAMRHRVQRILELVRLQRLFTFHSDSASAVAAFDRRATTTGGTMRIASRLTEIPGVRRWAAAHARAAGYGEQDVLALEVGLAEALSNVVRHAYHGEEQHEVVVELDAGRDALRVSVSDRGEPFDPSTRKVAEPDPDGPGDGGYGLQLIDDVMDEVTRRATPDGTVLTLVKHRTREESP